MNFKMNFKYILSIVLGLGVLIISCKSAHKDAVQSLSDQGKTEQAATVNASFLTGSWKDQSEKALDFTLYADGKAKSDNMATLLYQQWYLKDNQLFLVAKSIGNKNSFIDTIDYSIQKLNDSELTLKQGDLILNYKKVNNEFIQSEGNKTLPEQKSITLKGQLILGHEANTFKPCDNDKTFWVIDKTGKLKELYNKLTAGQKPYTPIFTEIEVMDKGRAKEGFPAEYESVYEVVNVLKTRNISSNDCK